MAQTQGYQNRRSGKDSNEDFPTPPWATRAFLAHIMPDDLSEVTVWEPAANRGHMSKVLAEYCGTVISSDKIDYGVGFPVIDFLDGPAPTDYGMTVDWIITNPPFNKAEEFVGRALEVADDGVAILVRASWMEGIGRYNRLFSARPPSIIAPYVERVPIVEGRLDPEAGTQMPYAWFVWEKDTPANRSPRLLWIPPCRKDYERETDYAN